MIRELSEMSYSVVFRQDFSFALISSTQTEIFNICLTNDLFRKFIFRIYYKQRKSYVFNRGTLFIIVKYYTEKKTSKYYRITVHAFIQMTITNPSLRYSTIEQLVQ